MKSPEIVPDFVALLKLSGLKKKELAKRLGVRPGTISAWGAAAPPYALAYLNLWLDYRIREGELQKARRLITAYVDLKLTLKETREQAVALLEILDKGDENT